MMTNHARDAILESLAVGSALGFLTLLLAVMSIVNDSRIVANEEAALARPDASVLVLSRTPDPGFGRIYAIKESSGPSYGAVFSGRSRDASAVFAAIFSPKGELRELRLVGSCAARLPEDARNAVDSLPGAEETLERASKAAMAAAEADS
jgi:hypothetical protein